MAGGSARPIFPRASCRGARGRQLLGPEGPGVPRRGGWPTPTTSCRWGPTRREAWRGPGGVLETHARLPVRPPGIVWADVRGLRSSQLSGEFGRLSFTGSALNMTEPPAGPGGTANWGLPAPEPTGRGIGRSRRWSGGGRSYGRPVPCRGAGTGAAWAEWRAGTSLRPPLTPAGWGTRGPGRRSGDRTGRDGPSPRSDRRQVDTDQLFGVGAPAHPVPRARLALPKVLHKDVVSGLSGGR